MKYVVFLLSVAVCIAGFSACNTDGPPPQANPINDLLSRVNPNCSALVPVPQTSFLPALWQGIFNDQVTSIATRTETKVFFLGDSITQGYRGAIFEDGEGIQYWNMFRDRYGNDKIINMGIGGDQTSHVLYRLLNGIFPDTCKPEYVTLMLGTNNISNPPGGVGVAQHAEEIAAGIGKIIQIINEKSPQTKILLFPVFPRGDRMDRVNAVNDIIKTFHRWHNVQYFDITPVFQNPNGTLKTHLYNPDLLHLSTAGYGAWTDEIIGLIDGKTRVNQLNLTSLIPQPATAVTPVYTASTDQYTLAINWQSGSTTLSGTDEFSPLLAYTATAQINIINGHGYTLSGLTANSFTHSNASSVVFNPAGSTVTLVFSPTSASVVTHRNLTNVIPPPTAGLTPPTEYNGVQYDLDITWTVTAGGGSVTTFAMETGYTATADITPKTGFHLEGLGADAFTHQDATISYSSGTVTLNFQPIAELTDLNLTDKFDAPLNRRVPVWSFEAAQYNGTIEWYSVSGSNKVLIDKEKEIFGSDNGMNIEAVVTINVKAGFGIINENFTYTGSTNVLVDSPAGNIATVTVTFAPIPEPTRLSSWRRGLMENDPNPDYQKTDLFWISYYSDNTFLIYNSVSGKNGATEAGLGTYIMTGVNGKTPGDAYAMTLNWVNAYAAIGSTVDNAELTIFIGDEVAGPKPALPGETDPITGNASITGAIQTGPMLNLNRRWHDGANVNYVNYD
ncbi:MAG: GDSL-type esterase/lipase family protein [Treponema sp.]|nr:GDSL-type esterase/lipase family protein [Treponema sp.]